MKVNNISIVIGGLEPLLLKTCTGLGTGPTGSTILTSMRVNILE